MELRVAADNTESWSQVFLFWKLSRLEGISLASLSSSLSRASARPGLLKHCEGQSPPGPNVGDKLPAWEAGLPSTSLGARSLTPRLILDIHVFALFYLCAVFSDGQW